MKRAVVYIRPNYQEQNLFPEFSLRAQKMRAKKFARKIEIDVVKCFEETCTTGDDFERPVFKEMIAYLIDNRNNIDILLLHNDDDLGVPEIDQGFHLMAYLNQFGIITLTDNGESYTMDDEKYESVLYGQTQDIDSVINYEKHVFIDNSHIENGKIIFIVTSENWKQKIAIREFCERKGMYIDSTIFTDNSDFAANEIIINEFDRLGHENGFTIITDSNYLLINSQAANEIIGNLFPLRLKKVLVPLLYNNLSELVIWKVSEFQGDHSKDPKRRITYGSVA